jgi:hypothetical protein
VRASHRIAILLAVACIVSAGAARHAQGEEANEGLARFFRGLAGRLDRMLVARCLTPEAARAMSDAVARGELEPVLGNEWTLERADLRGSAIDLEIRDPAGRAHTVTMALPGGASGSPDGQGRLFRFHLGESSSPDPRADRALLGLAALFDRVIPETALERCAGGDERRGEGRYPLALVLASAFLQLLVIAAAILFGLRAVRPEEDHSDVARDS